MVGSISTSSAALTHAFQRFERSAGDIAAKGTTQPQDDLASAVQEAMAARSEVGLNTSLLKSSVDMEKRVLDILV